MKDKLTVLIENSQKSIKSDIRNYIGASSIGSDCWRQIWYQYKGFDSSGVPAKTRRTWDIGKNLETLIAQWLTEAGIEIERNETTYQANDMPYFQGHFDGIITCDGERSVLEIKTAKDSSFKIFRNRGLAIWNPQYYAQVQSYMGMSNIRSAYILVLNKDSSEVSDEQVIFCPIFYEKMIEKARMIYESKAEPPRVSGSPLWFKCKMCGFNKTCHES